MSSRTRTNARRSYPWTTLDPDRRNTLLLVSGIVVIVIAAIALAAFGYYNERIKPNHETVLRVGERSWDVAALERRTRYAMVKKGADATKTQENIEDALRQMREEELVRQTARINGVTASRDDILNGYRTRLGLTTEASLETLRFNVRHEVRVSGLKLDELDDIVRAQVLDKKMNDKVLATVPERTTHVNLGLIQIAGEGKALELRQKILEGSESFSIAAGRESTHSSKDKAGDLGWVPRGALLKEVEAVAFSGPEDAGFLSEVISTPSGFFIIAVRGKEEREVSEESKELIVQQARSQQLEKTLLTVGAAVDLTQAQSQRIAVRVAAELPRPERA